METQIDNPVNRGIAGYMYLGYGYENMKIEAHHSMESTNEIQKPNSPPKGSPLKG
jgi:hypothetical protein